jgi:hypothetical protein
MKTWMNLVLAMSLSQGMATAAYAAPDFTFVQVQQVEVSSLSVDTSGSFSVQIIADLISDKPLAPMDFGQSLNAGTAGITCGHSGNFRVDAMITPESGNVYRLVCTVSDTPTSKGLPPSIEQISIYSGGFENTAVIPKGDATFSKISVDSFGTKSEIKLPTSTSVNTWGMVPNLYPRILWNVGLAINPPSSYFFPKFPMDGKYFVIFKSLPNESKATYLIDKKKQKITVNCPSSAPVYPLGGAVLRTNQVVIIGGLVFRGSLTVPYSGPAIRGKTLPVSCVSESVLTNHASEVVGYSETLPVVVSFPK